MLKHVTVQVAGARARGRVAEGDKAEQLRLSAEFKAALEAQLAAVEEARTMYRKHYV